jgi:hypothetical protein
MVSSLEILEKIRAYLHGQENLQSFRQWMIESHLDMQALKADNKSVDHDAARLLADLEGRYAELSDELVTEQVWRNSVAALVAPLPKSAESYFLTYYYAVPSAAFPFNSLNVSVSSQETTRNPINSVSNFRDPECVAA